MEQKNLNSELSQTLAMSHRLIANMEYFVTAMKRELASIEGDTSIDAADLLKTRGFIFAHAGLHDAASHDLEAVISQKESRNAPVCNKLSQVLIRKGSEKDLARALEVAEIAASQAETSGEKWHALHNMALAHLGLGDDAAAIDYADKALEVQDDFRTKAVKASAMRTRDGGDIRSSLVARGMLADFELDSATEDLKRRMDTVVLAATEPMQILY